MDCSIPQNTARFAAGSHQYRSNYRLVCGGKTPVPLIIDASDDDARSVSGVSRLSSTGAAAPANNRRKFLAAQNAQTPSNEIWTPSTPISRTRRDIATVTVRNERLLHRASSRARCSALRLKWAFRLLHQSSSRERRLRLSLRKAQMLLFPEDPCLIPLHQAPAWTPGSSPPLRTTNLRRPLPPQFTEGAAHGRPPFCPFP